VSVYDPEDMRFFPNRFRYAREQAGMTVHEAAEKVGRVKDAGGCQKGVRRYAALDLIRRIEGYDFYGCITDEWVAEVAKAYDVCFEWLCDGKGPMTCNER